MENEFGQDSVFSKKIRAGKRRTYFIDVRQTRGEDYYITLTESTKKKSGHGNIRHKLYLYKEDFNRFIGGLQEAVDHIKDDLLPDYDFEQFDRKHEEWEREDALKSENPDTNTNQSPEESQSNTDEDDIEMTW